VADSARIFVGTGEASGDRLAADLVAELTRRGHVLELRGVTGPRLREAGVHTVARAEDLSVFGFTGVVKGLPRVLGALRRAVDSLERWRPDLVLTVDAPSSMLKLARAARRRGIPAVHWVSPQVWAWRPGRVKKIATSVDALLCLFPMEPPMYAAEGARAVLTGHPAIERLQRDPGARARYGAQPVFALLPGSRASEIGALWPVLVAVAAKLRAVSPGCRFVVPVAPTVDRGALAGIDADFCADISEAASVADVAIASSGTATLELAVLGTPMVVIYKVSPLNYAIGSRLVSLERYSLPNIIAGREIVPEHIQQLDPDAIARDALALLGPAGAAQRAELDRVREALGTGAVGRAADEVERWLPGARHAAGAVTARGHVP
jgi:lipid-A-disaccharide synthase